MKNQYELIYNLKSKLLSENLLNSETWSKIEEISITNEQILINIREELKKKNQNDALLNAILSNTTTENIMSNVKIVIKIAESLKIIKNAQSNLD